MPSSRNNSLTLMKLPLEVLCHILKFLSLRKVLQIECVSRSMQAAVLAHLRNLTEIDFKEDAQSKEMFSFTIYNMSDYVFDGVLNKLPNLKYVYGFHPANIIVTDVGTDHFKSKFDLTTAGVCHILDDHNVIGIEINSLDLLDSICMSPVNVEVIGKFKSSLKSLAFFKTIELNERSLKITHLHLTDCTVASLINMDEYLEEIYLRNVRFTDDNPFINASMRNLKSFSMSRCMGPFLPVKYVPLVQALANAHQLHTLDIQDIRHLGGTIGIVCAEQGFQESFCRLESIVLGNNKHLQIEDIVNLVMRSADILSSLKLQPSLTKDRVFQALKASGVTINADFKELYLGWKEEIDQTRGEETPIDHRSSHITDNGMHIVGECFPTVRKLDIRNSPHLKDPRAWFTPGCHYLKSIEELCICNCWGIELKKFTEILTLLPDLKSLTLQDMFQFSTEGTYDKTFRFHMDSDATFTLSNGTYYIKPQGGALNGDNCLMPPYGSIFNHPVTRLSCGNITGNQESQHLANQNHPIGSNHWTNGNASFNHGNDSSSNEHGNQPFTDESRHRKHIHMRKKLSNLINPSKSNQLANQNDSYNHGNDSSANESRENTHMSIQLSNHNAPCSSNQLVNGSAALNHGKHSSANRSRRRKHMSIKLTNQREDNKLRDKEAMEKCQNCGKKRSQSPQCHSHDSTYNSTSPQDCSHNSPYAGSPSLERWSDASDYDERRRPKKRKGKSPSFEISPPEQRSEDWSFNKNSNTSKNGRKRKYKELGSNVPVRSVSPERCSCCPGFYEEPNISKRGKSIVTKNGVVSKSKSSKHNKRSKRKKTKKQKVCTCSKQYKDTGCQTTIEDITQIYQRCYLGDISMSSVTMETDRIIVPGEFQPGVGMKVTLSRKCTIHNQSKDRSHIGCSTDVRIMDTNDSVLKYQCFSPAPLVLQLSYNRLESVTLHDINIAELHISCNKLVNLCVSNCAVLKTIKLHEAPYLENIQVSQCFRFNEELFMKEVYKLPPICSRFISLCPLHFVDTSLFYDIMRHRSSNQYGSIMMLDYSDQPSHTRYNKERMKSWITLLERMAEESMTGYGFPEYLEMKNPHKEINCLTGNSDDGSDWTLLCDIPWIDLLHQCPNIDKRYMSNTDWCRDGIYCMEQKGHHNFRDAFTAIQDSIKNMKSSNIGLYDRNILTYINTCDTSGIPSTDNNQVL